MITTITLNASIDKAYFLDNEISPGSVMRVKKFRNSAGGKGINVARVISQCGEEVKATGLVGGYNGECLKDLLKKDKVCGDFISIGGETRCCINVLDYKNESTEFLEPGPYVTDAEIDEFINKLEEITSESRVVTISGSAPNGVDATIYEKIINYLKKIDKKVILDTSGDFLKNGINAAPTMVKPNKEELENLFGKQIEDTDDYEKCAQYLMRKGIKYVVISLGGEGSLLYCEDGVYKATPPNVVALNTVGCGDSMVGAFAIGLDKEKSPDEMLKFASAVATANAMSQDTGSFDKEILQEIIDNTKVEKTGE